MTGYLAIYRFISPDNTNPLGRDFHFNFGKNKAMFDKPRRDTVIYLRAFTLGSLTERCLFL